jgi:hypothetical protein
LFSQGAQFASERFHGEDQGRLAVQHCMRDITAVCGAFGELQMIFGGVCCFRVGQGCHVKSPS